jgi:hypothetical protein
MTIEELYNYAKRNGVEKYFLDVSMPGSELSFDENNIKIDKKGKNVFLYFSEEELNSVGWF